MPPFPDVSQQTRARGGSRPHALKAPRRPMSDSIGRPRPRPPTRGRTVSAAGDPRGQARSGARGVAGGGRTHAPSWPTPEYLATPPAIDAAGPPLGGRARGPARGGTLWVASRGAAPLWPALRQGITFHALPVCPATIPRRACPTCTTRREATLSMSTGLSQLLPTHLLSIMSNIPYGADDRGGRIFESWLVR